MPQIKIERWLLQLFCQYAEQIIGLLWMLAAIGVASIAYFATDDPTYQKILGIGSFMLFVMAFKMLLRSKYALDSAIKEEQCKTQRDESNGPD